MGDLGLRAYLSGGEAKASLTLRVTRVQLFGFRDAKGSQAVAPDQVDGDLTFLVD